MSLNSENVPTIVVDASPVFGGAQRSLLTTLSGLSEKGVDLVVVAGSSRLAEELKSRSIPVVPFPFKLWKRSLYGLMNAASDILQFKGFLSGLGDIKGSTFYANGIQSGLLLSLCLPKSAKLVVHHRDIQCPKFALKKVLKRANWNIVLTDFMAEKIKERADTIKGAQIKTVYNAFDFDQLQTLSEENIEVELPSDRLLVTFVADLVPWKRHDLFVEAMVRAARREPALSGIIVGDVREPSGESYRRSIETLITSLSGESTVSLIGSVRNAVPLIRESQVMCALSDDEPFGRTVIEAAAVGTPMVLRVPGGPVELAEGLPSVMLVGDDPDEIADAILKMAKEPRNNLSDAWKQRFSMDTHCNAIYEMLND